MEIISLVRTYVSVEEFEYNLHILHDVDTEMCPSWFKMFSCRCCYLIRLPQADLTYSFVFLSLNSSAELLSSEE